jgi:hypothetical protein
MKKSILIFFGLSLLIAGLYHFCEKKTQGFRLYSLLSDLPNDPRWEVPPPSKEEMLDVHTRLDQPFTFLGSGGWCYAFLGADNQTVIKFYKHDHLCLPKILHDFSWSKLLFSSPTLPVTARYFQEFNFQSCTLLYNQVKPFTGLIYVHLNKTQNVLPTITLYDPIGVSHQIDLNCTEFILQHKAELLFPHIERLDSQGDIAHAKQAIDQMFNCLLTLSQAGAKDLDQKLYENFGYVEDQAIAVDLSSFVPNEEIKRPAVYKKELICKTRRLSRWLKKHYPDLYTYCEEKLNEIIEQSN